MHTAGLEIWVSGLLKNYQFYFLIAMTSLAETANRRPLAGRTTQKKRHKL